MNEYDDFDSKYQPSNDPVTTFQPELDLDNEEVWSNAYLPVERTTYAKGNYQGKVVFEHIQIKIITSNEPLMGCGPLPEWLAKKRCLYSIGKYKDNLCV